VTERHKPPPPAYDLLARAPAPDKPPVAVKREPSRARPRVKGLTVGNRSGGKVR
jgi:hypothetical protein